MAALRPVGIDLGTTNSAVASIDETGRTAMVLNEEGQVLTPSVVLFDDDEVVVGREAKRAAALKADAVAQWAKRDMGKSAYSQPVRGHFMPPEVIQANILKKLRDDAVRALGQDIGCVVTVPAYFNDLHRRATANTCDLAEVRMLDIVNEPTAAALAFGEARGYLTAAGAPKESMRIVVYDLGGGTFDVTLVQLNPGEFRTIATAGDVQLGGYDWDLRLMDHAASTFKRVHGADPRDDRASLYQLLDEVVDAKHTLSARDAATINVKHQGRELPLRVARSEFEALTADLVERTSFTTRQVLSAAGISWNDISSILLVGGSTRMPMIRDMLNRLSGIHPDHTVNPDEAVARGAAIYAKYLVDSGLVGEDSTESAVRTPEFQVVNVNAHSLGIEGINPDTQVRENKIIIPRNTALPAKITKKCITKQTGQKSIVVQVLEGESKRPDACTRIGRATIRNLPMDLPQGWPVEVTYEYGTNGRLHVWVEIPGTAQRLELELEREGGLSPEGLAKWRTLMRR